MMARMMSFAVTPSGSWPPTRTSMFVAFFWISVWVASTCSTSAVPTPCASAPKATCAEGADDALAQLDLGKVFDAEIDGVPGQRLDLHAAFLVLDAEAAVRRGRH